MNFANEKKKDMGRKYVICSSSHTHTCLRIEVSKNYRQNEKTWLISVANKLPGQYHIRVALQGIIEPYTEF
jgi:hypothetical protein